MLRKMMEKKFDVLKVEFLDALNEYRTHLFEEIKNQKKMTNNSFSDLYNIPELQKTLKALHQIHQYLEKSNFDAAHLRVVADKFRAAYWRNPENERGKKLADIAQQMYQLKNVPKNVAAIEATREKLSKEIQEKAGNNLSNELNNESNASAWRAIQLVRSHAKARINVINIELMEILERKLAVKLTREQSREPIKFTQQQWDEIGDLIFKAIKPSKELILSVFLYTERAYGYHPDTQALKKLVDTLFKSFKQMETEKYKEKQQLTHLVRELSPVLVKRNAQSLKTAQELINIHADILDLDHARKLKGVHEELRPKIDEMQRNRAERNWEKVNQEFVLKVAPKIRKKEWRGETPIPKGFDKALEATLSQKKPEQQSLKNQNNKIQREIKDLKEFFEGSLRNIRRIDTQSLPEELKKQQREATEILMHLNNESLGGIQRLEKVAEVMQKHAEVRFAAAQTTAKPGGFSEPPKAPARSGKLGK